MFVPIMKNRITAIDLKSLVIHALIAYLINFNLNACISKQTTQQLQSKTAVPLSIQLMCLGCITHFYGGDHLVGACAGQTLSYSLPVWISSVQNTLLALDTAVRLCSMICGACQKRLVGTENRRKKEKGSI